MGKEGVKFAFPRPLNIPYALRDTVICSERSCSWVLRWPRTVYLFEQSPVDLEFVEPEMEIRLCTVTENDSETVAEAAGRGEVLVRSSTIIHRIEIVTLPVHCG